MPFQKPPVASGAPGRMQGNQIERCGVCSAEIGRADQLKWRSPYRSSILPGSASRVVLSLLAMSQHLQCSRQPGRRGCSAATRSGCRVRMAPQTRARRPAEYHVIRTPIGRRSAAISSSARETGDSSLLVRIGRHFQPFRHRPARRWPWPMQCGGAARSGRRRRYTRQQCHGSPGFRATRS